MKKRSSCIYILIVIPVLGLAFSAFAGDLQEAHELFLRQRYDAAIEKYNVALSKTEEDEAANIHFYLGRSYEMKNWWEKALEHFEKIRRDYPKHPVIGETMVEIGQCYVRLQKMEDALLVFDNNSRIFDDPWIQASSLLNKAAVQGTVNKSVFDLDGAIESLDGVINDYQFKGLAIKSQYYKGIFLNRQRKYEEAIEAWKHVLEEGPETLWADFVPAYIAITQQKMGRLIKAQETIQENLAQNERAVKAVQILNKAYQTQTGSGEGVYVERIGRKDKEGKVQFYQLYRITHGKKSYHFFIYAESIKIGDQGKKISFDGNVRIADSNKNPSVVLEASNVEIDTDSDKAMGNGNVNFTRRDVLKKGKPVSMQNLDYLELDLQSLKFNINR